MSHSGDEFAGMAHGRDGEETFEDIYEEGEHHEEVPLTAMKRKRADGIEEKEDGEPIMPANLDDAITNNRKFDTAESALMAVYQQSLMAMAYCVKQKKARVEAEKKGQDKSSTAYALTHDRG